MLLTKDGVTFDVKSAHDVARLKKAGYVEEKAAAPVAESPAEKAAEKAADKKAAEKEKKGGD